MGRNCSVSLVSRSKRFGRSVDADPTRGRTEGIKLRHRPHRRRCGDQPFEPFARGKAIASTLRTFGLFDGSPEAGLELIRQIQWRADPNVIEMRLFRRMTSWSISLSRLRSATRRRSRMFSSSSCRSFFSSEGISPP